MVVLGFDSIVDAADAAPAVVALGPTACEGLDSRIVKVVKSRRGASAVPELPTGNAWLFVEFAGDAPEETIERARQLAHAGLAASAAVIRDPEQQGRLWRIREDGAGLAGRAPSGAPAWPGWEDAAVPPAALGAYLTRFDELVQQHGLTSAPFGHFGEGCMHVRLDFPFDQRNATLRFGVHGGCRRSRGELRRFPVWRAWGRASPERATAPDVLTGRYEVVLRAQVRVRPADLLNPGVLVDPAPIDADVRVADIRPLSQVNNRRLAFAYEDDDGDLARAVHRCTGVGKCRADNSASGGVMCPSYLATREEKDSTRGRARVLQDVVAGRLDWADESVHDALDLCLSCKGGASDCPTGIDMATYKSEVLHQTYRRRRRPRSHYTLGWLPRWTRIASRVPRTSNALIKLPLLRPLAGWVAGIDRRRSVPSFAPQRFTKLWDRIHTGARTNARPVILFVDTFNEAFSPAVAAATVRTLRAAGLEPQLLDKQLCCALTWITTGQLDSASGS
jgi:hypothetical protein